MTPTLRPSLVNGRWGDPALFVELAFERGAVLFDLGDLSAVGARDLLRVGHVFVSHMHVDHLIGFDTLLRVHVGREKRIEITGPDGLIASIGHRLASYTWDLAERYRDDLVLDVAEMLAPDSMRRSRFRFLSGFAEEKLGTSAIEGGILAEAPLFSVEAAILEHHGACLGFALSEPLHLNVWANKVKDRGLPVGPWLKILKDAVRAGSSDDTPVVLPDGTSRPLGTLRDLVSVEPGQKIGYVTDIRDTEANRAVVAALCRNADTLFIDASFAAADAALAQSRGHLTTKAAGEIARAAGVRRVEPFHFSPRYKGSEEMLMEEVDQAFRGQQTAEPVRSE